MSKLYEAYCKAYRLNDKNDEGFFDIVGDIYNSDEVQSLKQYEQHLEIDRLQHITSVSFVAYVACKKLGLDYRSAAVSAVMHDLFYYDWHEKHGGHRQRAELLAGEIAQGKEQHTDDAGAEEDRDVLCSIGDHLQFLLHNAKEGISGPYPPCAL